MLKTGSIPGGHIYIRIIKGMTDSGEKDKAMKTWKQMMSMGIRHLRPLLALVELERT